MVIRRLSSVSTGHFVIQQNKRPLHVVPEGVLNSYKKSSNIKDVYCVPQVKNIEDELIRAMGLKNIEELLNSKSKKDFKRDMLRERNLKSKFESHHFDIQKLWAMNPATPFDKITNHSKKIKI